MKATRDPKYGNVNYPGLTQGLVQGDESMADISSNANAPISKPTAQTAQLRFLLRNTRIHSNSLRLMGREAEEGIRQRMLGEPGGLNNRQELYRRGN